MRKAYVQQPDLLLVGVDVSKAKHSACLGTPISVSRRKLALTPTREGLARFEQPLQQQLVKQACRHSLIAMEPSGIYWQALYARLQGGGYGVCLVHCQAVRNNRKTLQEGTSKTDETDAYSVFDLLRQGQFFLPVERDSALQAAYRLRQRSMALKKRSSHLRHHLRAAIHLAFPALHPLVPALTQPTTVRFLQTHPTPASNRPHSRPSCLEQWQPRQRCGQWRPETFHRIYDLATTSIGLHDPYRIDEVEITTRATDLVDALTKQPLWLTKAIELLAHREDDPLLVQLPRIDPPPAAAILTAMGNIHADHNCKQLVKLAGLDVRLFESGSRIRKLPKISPIGSAYLRYWLYHDAMRLIAHEPHFQVYDQRRKPQSPGQGAGQRALIAVWDHTIRMLYRILTDHVPYNPQKDQSIAAYYTAQRPAA